ncbi:rhomboid protease ROM10 [Plasmodium brasilianum]|uniref:Rhomboid-like protease n=2 Tax=Plasmodium (Plasmodium) TaxID=418103 RepID=A0A1C3KZN1_PLAMA|nr:rhomboid protease ROM10, putative [Plasmodium malariae]KAI4837315.1 rhomboid protease ROM10 [Plasmodium brasilianum]SBT79734.1 rhomboid protease ROM10, putative [Plasmodium malariae]SCO93197.1 rhomboid protease ROM10, putative [Plasmodium malariae]
MRFLTNINNNNNNVNSNSSYDSSNLLIYKYTRSFNITFKKDIKFIQILFPSFTIFCVTFFFSLLLYLCFFCLEAFYFNRKNPLFIDEDVLKRFGLNRFYISNNYQYYKLITATLFHSSIWNLIINTYYLMNIGIVVEKSYGKVQYIMIMLLSTLCGHLLMLATSPCADVHMGITAILSGFMGLFLQEVVTNYKQLTDKWDVIGSFIFAVLSLYLTISMFAYNGNFVGNIGGIFGGFSYPYIFNKESFNGPQKNVKITFVTLTLLLIIGTFISLIFVKC